MFQAWEVSPRAYVIIATLIVAATLNGCIEEGVCQEENGFRACCRAGTMQCNEMTSPVCSKRQADYNKCCALAVANKAGQAACVRQAIDEAKGLHIVVSVHKPKDINKIRSKIKAMPLVFSETGVKEQMTVKKDRWLDFVQRQMQKMQAEVDDADEDVFKREAAEIVKSMEDWKDLSRYKGKHISMSSTMRGNQLHVFVSIFEEKDEGVEFLRINYRKKVEAGKVQSILQTHSWFEIVGKTFFSKGAWLLQALEHDILFDEYDSEAIEILQREDVAKILIAEAFQRPLARDGVIMEILDAPADEL